jgi:hypothetical protein
VIDGNEDSLYAELLPYHLEKNVGLINNDNDLKTVYKMAWDSAYLYVLVNVDDDTLNMAALDGVEILIDPDNSKSNKLSYNNRHYRFFLNRPKEGGEHHYLTAKINRDDFIEGVLEERILNEGSYTIEMALPWATLGTDPSVNNLLGINIKVRDYDGSSEEMDGALYWRLKEDAPKNAPMGFGTAKLIYE